MHEVLADKGHFATAIGFALALSLRALRHEDHVIWARQEAVIAEAGSCYGPGLAELGVEPQHLTILRLRTVSQVLRAGIEAARCAAIGVVILETLDASHKVDLTATRRLKLAAEKSGITIFLVRAASQSVPSAAQTRWLARPAVSHLPCEYGPTRPRFDLTLLRHRAGLPEMRLTVEWDRDRKAFTEAILEPVAAVPFGRLSAA